MTRTKPPSKDVMIGYYLSSAWDNVARYFQAGRRFRRFTDQELERAWAKAWRTYYDDYRPDLWTWCMDIEGELLLHFRFPPQHLLPPSIHYRIETRRRVHESRSDVNRRLKDEVECFMRECARAN